jgi:integrase
VAIADAIDAMPRQAGNFAPTPKEPEPASERTKATYASRMRSFAKWLVRAQRLKSNPLEALSFAEGTAEPAEKRRALALSEAGRLVAAAEARPERELRTVRVGKRAGQRSQKEPPPHALQRMRRLGLCRKTIYLTVLWSGLRRGEVAALQWRDLELDGEQPAIRLRAETTKSKRSARLPVHAQLLEALQAWRTAQPTVPTPEVLVFPSLPDMKAFRADLDAAGIPYKVQGRGKIDFHALRKTFGTLLATAGVPRRVRQAAMRHADPRLTETIYLDEDLLPLFEHVAAAPAIVDLG